MTGSKLNLNNSPLKQINFNTNSKKSIQNHGVVGAGPKSTRKEPSKNTLGPKIASNYSSVKSFKRPNPSAVIQIIGEHGNRNKEDHSKAHLQGLVSSNSVAHHNIQHSSRRNIVPGAANNPRHMTRIEVENKPI